MRIFCIVLILFVLLSTPCYGWGLIEKDMADKIIQYRLNTVERSKLRVFVARNHSSNPLLLSAKLCRMADYDSKAWNPYDLVFRGKANCQAFAFLFYMLLDKPCRIVYDKTHMWNEVWINGKWVKYDLTALNHFF